MYYQNYVNEVIRNLIIHCESIFTAKIPGFRYQKYDHANATMTTTTTENNREVELFMDDNEDYNIISNKIHLTNDSAVRSLFCDFKDLNENNSDEEIEYAKHFNNQMLISNLGLTNNYDSKKSSELQFSERLGCINDNRLKPEIQNNNLFTNTYCYSSSEENDINTNLNKKLNKITAAQLEKELTFTELPTTFNSFKQEINFKETTRPQEKYKTNEYNLAKDTDISKSNFSEDQNPQKISTSTTTNSRNLPITNSNAIQSVLVNATNPAEKSIKNNDNYASIMGK